MWPPGKGSGVQCPYQTDHYIVLGVTNDKEEEEGEEEEKEGTDTTTTTTTSQKRWTTRDRADKQQAEDNKKIAKTGNEQRRR